MSRTLAWCTVPLLLLQCLAVDFALLLSWPTLALVLVSTLKLRELRQPADLRLVALLQLLAVGCLAAQSPGLLASVLQLLTVLLALAALLAQELGGGGGGSLRDLLLRSLQLTAAALPLALLLFLLLPRLGPLWLTDLGASARARTGLSPDLDPLAIAELVRSDAPAARVSFGAERLPPQQGYWRVLVHDQFDGRRWRRSPGAALPRQERQPLQTNQPRQWWTVEPSRSRAVPWDGQSLAASQDLRPNPNGEQRLLLPPAQRRSYRLQQTDTPLAWQRRPPTAIDLALPDRRQPRLEALAARWRGLPSDRDRLAAAEAWFRAQPFRYSLQPGAWPSGRGLDVFLFDRQVGFCGHYASALSALMRSAGVPARVVSGYQGGQLVQPLGGSAYLDIRQSDAHAWSEVWLQGQGWQRVDPTTWIRTAGAQDGSDRSHQRGSGTVTWWRWLQWQWWGLDLVWTQWWLAFDQSGQQALLERLFGSQQRWLSLLVLLAAVPAVWIGLLLWRRLPSGDPLQHSLRLLQRCGVEPLPGETFSQLCQRAALRVPHLREELMAMADLQRRLAHAPLTAVQRLRHQRLWQQGRQQLSRQLRSRTPDPEASP